MRCYTGWGLSPGDVGRIIVFCGATVGVGLASAGGIASLIQPALVAHVFWVAPAAVVAVGVLLFCLVFCYLGLAAFVHRPIRIRNFELPVPHLGLALGQVAVGTTDFLLVAAVLHQMLSAFGSVASTRERPRRTSTPNAASEGRPRARGGLAGLVR